MAGEDEDEDDLIARWRLGVKMPLLWGLAESRLAKLCQAKSKEWQAEEGIFDDSMANGKPITSCPDPAAAGRAGIVAGPDAAAGGRPTENRRKAEEFRLSRLPYRPNEHPHGQWRQAVGRQFPDQRLCQIGAQWAGLH